MSGNQASSKPIPIYRPNPPGWWLARSSQLVQATVKQLDDSANAAVLLSNLKAAEKTEESLKLWALQLQTITHKWNGNYLNHFFVKLRDELKLMPHLESTGQGKKNIAKQLEDRIRKQGVTISP